MPSAGKKGELTQSPGGEAGMLCANANANAHAPHQAREKVSRTQAALPGWSPEPVSRELRGTEAGILISSPPCLSGKVHKFHQGRSLAEQFGCLLPGSHVQVPACISCPASRLQLPVNADPGTEQVIALVVSLHRCPRLNDMTSSCVWPTGPQPCWQPWV